MPIVAGREAQNSTLRVTRNGRVTHLMVLDGEKDETVRVFLKQRLAGLHLLDTGRNLGGFDGLLDGLVGSHVNGGRRVLLATEVELLDRRVAHLEVLEGGSSLCKQRVLAYLPLITRRKWEARDVTSHTCLEGVSCTDIVLGVCE